VSVLPILSSCRNEGPKSLDETPTRGNIKITVDESFQPLLDTEIFTFTHLYTSANVTPRYKPEFDVIEDYMNDSVKVIVTSKKLTDSQVQYLRESQVIARTTTFAWDALALVTNKSNNAISIRISEMIKVVPNWRLWSLVSAKKASFAACSSPALTSWVAGAAAAWSGLYFSI